MENLNFSVGINLYTIGSNPWLGSGSFCSDHELERVMAGLAKSFSLVDKFLLLRVCVLVVSNGVASFGCMARFVQCGGLLRGKRAQRRY
jgi:hypothetical protein